MFDVHKYFGLVGRVSGEKRIKNSLYKLLIIDFKEKVNTEIPFETAKKTLIILYHLSKLVWKADRRGDLAAAAGYPEAERREAVGLWQRSCRVFSVLLLTNSSKIDMLESR